MQLEVRIERYADQGRCVAHIDGRVVFVRFALPCELVEIELDEPHNRKNRFATGEVVRVIEPSPYRVDPVWQLAGPAALGGGGVGGADLIHVSLPGQLAWKQAVIADQMTRLGHLDIERTVGSIPISRAHAVDEHGKRDADAEDEAHQGLGWRTRIDLVADVSGKPAMRRRGTHIPVLIDAMPLATEYIALAGQRAGVWSGDIAGIQAGDRIRLCAPEPRECYSGAYTGDLSVLVNGRPVLGQSVVHETVRIADPRAEQHPDGSRATLSWNYTVDADGFWQVHRNAPGQLVYKVLSAVLEELDGDTHATVWDLYSGAGLFTLPIATTAVPDGMVLSIEGASNAVRHARRTLKTYGLQDSVCALDGDVYRTLAHSDAAISRFIKHIGGRYASNQQDVTQRLTHPSVVVLDPPRAGAKRQVCEQIAYSSARSVVYVACDPASLARDIATFTQLGFAPVCIEGLDIYPHTHHVESMAVLRRV